MVVMYQMIAKMKMGNGFQFSMKKVEMYFWKMLQWL